MVCVTAANISIIFHVSYYNYVIALSYILVKHLMAGNFGPTMNISLNGSAVLYIEAIHIGYYICDEFEVYWEIVRADAETERYTVSHHYGTYENHQDRGLSFEGFCDIECHQILTITPTDMRYDGAQITGVVNIPECYNTSNVTNITTIRIQG